MKVFTGLTNKLMVSGVAVAASMAANPEFVQHMNFWCAASSVPMRLSAAILASGSPGLGTVGDKFVKVIAYIARIVGIALMLFGGFSFATSFTAHDATQKRNGILEFMSGLLIFLLPQLINYLTGQTTVSTDTNAPF